ncbi:AER248Wp [Eremothecium gossypii ATCC 10895]|uniref:Adenylyltransferase and sulfurtransferase UBA4 n=1 Tax=Eremothecium gossypii (strain ATCC 10895 / CBS 109.51 / FGSC 9923 / NRRL Y-1056) TaxID=284811 RepID=UBA4_EREGS|nr:AER248Wp [Eremothecium gossypii ATCC 10895]Q756K6.1 RecName: Full=Adenylyltransferase and sulfurtransferase UBA4; AltName: Full=Ubiquitin-like protein activator 4; Includes: RecName: Full=Adenylyltransferase UBA4; Includes: RecName: Full=Sulfurtransferase UBA4 [Eremothecium gossypii ATCC 10895]AAS52929.1 AER248Wp [Eremothecium gossypii ATCC 10895]AEY97237.1 FAER248Wp [Eremothecium gossypii FDAG1]
MTGESLDGSLHALTIELDALRRENANLKQQLKEKDGACGELPMSLEEFQRYGRQMIVGETGGLSGQVKLRSARVLIVGAGGLGCPALQYLAGAGIGHLGIVDNDVVEESNLHRQPLHDTSKVGLLKCDSAKEALSRLNPYCSIKTYPVRLSYANAFEIFPSWDLILDCTDSPMSRYLISDVAVNLGKTVVSGSGLGTEGQLSIYNFENKGPCYRCFYPIPPRPGSVVSCQSGGVLGPCIGVLGIMMAVEALKILFGIYTLENFKPFLMQYSGFPYQTLRMFKMRNRKQGCLCCGDNPTITKSTIESGHIKYEAFCGAINYDVLSKDERLSASEFEANYWSQKERGFVCLDVRPRLHYEISHLPGTYNMTVKELDEMEGSIEELQKHIPVITPDLDIVVLCRYGNDSRLATRILKDKFKLRNVRDVKGGYFAYIDEINPSLPKY